MRAALCALAVLACAGKLEAQAEWGPFGGFTWHELSNPGFHLGAEYGFDSSGPFRSLVSASFQFYTQPGTETGYALHARWSQRYTAPFGLTLESCVGLGAQYTRWDATVYEFDDAVATSTAQARTGASFAPHVLLGPGYDFRRTLGVPLHLYVRPGIVVLYPDQNGVVQASLIGEIGVRWILDG